MYNKAFNITDAKAKDRQINSETDGIKILFDIFMTLFYQKIQLWFQVAMKDMALQGRKFLNKIYCLYSIHINIMNYF